MSDVLLEVRGLKTYFFVKRGILKAVDEVSFAVGRGQSLGLVGESGCGKTITAMSILRLEPKPAGKIVAGRILFEGEDLAQKNETEMRKIRGGKISLIMQDPMTSLNPVYTIGDQLIEAIELHSGIKDKKAIRARAIQVLEEVEIPEAASRMSNYPHQMSGGMRQRVVGAIAISCSPSLLIADEPTTSLDVTTQAQYLRLLRKIQQQSGMAMIFITHDLGIVSKMCDQACVMYSGKIVERAEVRELWNNPRHPYTISLMKSVPSLTTKVDRLYSIDGMVPSLMNLPEGCSFRPRCSRAIDRCALEFPPEEQIGPGHYACCWVAKEGI
jgi:oligopeptide/dipeptide ABC transporter ATP-binding protein